MSKYIKNIPPCYLNFIGVVSCEDKPEPKSGFYIESLEGISVKRAANIADESYMSGIELIEDKIILALKKLESEVLGKMMLLNYAIPTTQPTYQKGDFLEEVNGFGGERGLKIYQNNSLSPFSCVVIKKIYIKSQTTSQKTLYLKDKNGVVLWEKLVDLVSNEVVVIEDYIKIYNTESFLVLDNSDINTYKTKLYKNSDCCGYSKSSRPNKFFSVTGWNGLNCEDNGFGLGLEVGMECDMGLVMCDVLPQLKKAALYWSGVEILNEQLASNRLNLINIYSKEWAVEKVEEWKEAIDNELNIVVPNFVKGLKKRDKFCISCNDRGIRKVQTVKPLRRSNYNSKTFFRR